MSKPGGWELNVMVGRLPQEVATVVDKMNEVVGCKYEAIAYLASQTVHGVNHAVLAKQTLLAQEDIDNVVLLIFNECGGTCVLVNNERVLESSNRFGGLKVKVQTGAQISEEAMDAFNKAYEGYTGSKITPIALVGEQVVHGMNYLFVCEVAALDGSSKIALITVSDEGFDGQFVDLLKSAVRVKTEESLKVGMRMSAPWTIFYKEVLALFEKDPQVKVLYNYEEPELKLQVVDNDEKAAALSRFIPTKKEFGNVVLNISVVGDNGQVVPDINCTDMEAIEKMFDGNGAVAFTRNVVTMFGDHITYVVFKREVVQFFADNMTDLYGAISTLYQDIAKEVFESTLCTSGKCFFSTEAANSLGYAFTWLQNPAVSLGKPLGEWP